MEQTQRDQMDRPTRMRAKEGAARWWFGSFAVIKATGADTRGQMTIVEITDPAGARVPGVVSHKYDFGFWILGGSVELEVEGTTIDARAGDFVYVPRGATQRHRVGEDGCHWVLISAPAGLEDLIMAVSEPAKTPTLPPPAETELDADRFASLFEAHGVQPLP